MAAQKKEKLTKFTTQEDLEFLRRNRETIIGRVGREKYEQMVGELEADISRRERTGKIASEGPTSAI